MNSNSIRISADLFEHAQRQGAVLTRSAAQQIEHWARLGAAVEHSGLPVGELVELLRGNQVASTVPEQNLWATKRAQQARDIAAVESGKARADSMSWFSGGRARGAKAPESPL
jgi:hypothetical protein